MFGRDKQPGPGSGWIDPAAAMTSDDLMGLDPELAELMRLEEAERTGLIPPAAAAAAPASGSDDRISRLQILAELRAEGALTDAEFEAEKARILNGP
ncbi:MAG TPA: SHOCT domain-containing protein [Streptosporangiaceae bacterium]